MSASPVCIFVENANEYIKHVKLPKVSPQVSDLLHVYETIRIAERISQHSGCRLKEGWAYWKTEQSIT